MLACHYCFMVYDELDGKVVLITGALGGIGSATAEEFATHGARVIMNDKKESPSALIEKYPLRVKFVKADVSRRPEVNSMVNQAAEFFGRLDILVNNAGVRYQMPAEEYDEDRFVEMWNINFMGAVYATLAALPHLKKTRGKVINISSAAAIGNDLPGSTYYAVTKAAVIIFTKRLAFELGNSGVRVNAIAPGVVKTEMSMMGKIGEEAIKLEEDYRSRTYLRMLGEPQHIAKIACFLASDSSGYMSGQVIVPDGGGRNYLTHGL